MPYDLLQEVIAYIKKTSTCPNCKAHFHDEDIFVMSTTAAPDTEVCYGIFVVVCGACQTEGCLLIEASDHEPHETLEGEHTTAITVNEVLDMHNFLKKWKGDLKELFKE